jgi:hypothetical protein
MSAHSLPPLLVTKATAAELLACSPKHVVELEHAHEFKRVNTGTLQITYRYADIVAYVERLTEVGD